MAGRRSGEAVRRRRLDPLGLVEMGRACDRFLRERGVEAKGMREVIDGAVKGKGRQRRKPKLDAVERAAREIEGS